MADTSRLLKNKSLFSTADASVYLNRHIYRTNALWQKVWRFLVQLLSSCFGLSSNPRLEQNFWRPDGLWAAVAVDTSSRQPDLSGFLTAALPRHPVVFPQNKRISLLIFTFVAHRWSTCA